MLLGDVVSKVGAFEPAQNVITSLKSGIKPLETVIVI